MKVENGSGKTRKDSRRGIGAGFEGKRRPSPEERECGKDGETARIDEIFDFVFNRYDFDYNNITKIAHIQDRSSP